MRWIVMFFFLAGGVAYAQYPAQQVLVEAGTGVWCASCPTAVQMIEKMHEEGMDIAVVKYHSAEAHEDPFENEASLARINYYQVNAYPTMFIDGRQVTPWNGYQQAATLYDSAFAKMRQFRLELTGQWEGEVLALKVVAQKTIEASTEDLKLYVAITESDIPYQWYGETEVDYATRILLPDKNGQELLFEEGEAVTKYYEARTEELWNDEKLQVVAFIQNNHTKEIMQAASFTSQQVGVEETESDKVTVAPNPARDYIFLRPAGLFSEVSLFNGLGKQVYYSAAPGRRVDMRYLERGLYVLQGKAGGKVFRKKVVIW